MGWYLDTEYHQKFDFNKSIEQDTTLYAKFVINQYIITCDSNGGNGVSPIIQDYNSIVQLPVPTKKNYTFAGWRLKDSNEEYTLTRMPAKDVELVAIWKVGVDVYIDGSKVDTILLNVDGDVIDYPAPEDITTNPNSEKYFHGWFTDPNFQTPLLPTTVFTKNTRIYGEWITVYSNSFTYSVSNGTANITGFNNNTATVVVIPSYINSFPVTTISASAFKNKTMIKTAILCDGIKRISSSAFRNCSSMEKIDIPQSVEFIDSSAFDDCSLLPKNTKENMMYLGGHNSEYEFALRPIDTTVESITIDNSCRSITASAFSVCSQLSSISMDNDYYFSQNGILYQKSPLSFIKIPEKIGGDIVIPDGIESIDTVFSGNSNITSVVLPDSINDIRSQAFANCSALTSITIPSNSVTSIGSWAFLNCSALKSIIVPKSTITIGEGAFKGCNSLESMTLPFVGYSRETSSSALGDSPSPYLFGYIFGSGTFYADGEKMDLYSTVRIDESLKSEIDNMLKARGYTWHGQCKKKYNDGYGDYIGYYIPRSLREITITDATEISRDAFCHCNFLTSIVLGNTITAVSSSTFAHWNSSQTIYVESVSKPTGLSSSAKIICDYKNKIVDGSLMYEAIDDGASYQVINYLGDSTEISIPETVNGKPVTAISDKAFGGCNQLTSITLPDSLTSIGSYAFEYCNQLTSITLPDGLTSIGSYAFRNCRRLLSITLPKGVKSVGERAFAGWYDQQVIYKSSHSDTTNWNYYWLTDCEAKLKILYN